MFTDSYRVAAAAAEHTLVTKADFTLHAWTLDIGNFPVVTQSTFSNKVPNEFGFERKMRLTRLVKS